MVEEIKDVENLETEENSLAEDIAKLKEQDSKEQEKPQEEPQEELQEEKEAEPTDEEKARQLKAQEDYKKRQEERRRKAAEAPQKQYEEKAAQAVQDADKEAIEYFKELKKQQIFNQSIKKAEVELTYLEGEFKVAYPDYEDKVNQAMKLTKYRLVEQGMSEAEADQLLKREKVLLADRAAAQGQDPVEAVYKEASTILSVFEKFAEEMGYSKGKKKTNLQSLREASKPNAMSGGAGKGATAARKTYDDMEVDEVNELSIGQMLKGAF